MVLFPGIVCEDKLLNVLVDVFQKMRET